jgi:phosphatidylserine/phosphatidylglycerophosphate/cardiolipin synthase-like enzyme
MDASTPARDASAPPPTPACPAWDPTPPAAPPPRFSAVFSVRDAANGEDLRIESTVIGLIRRAIPGSRVRIAMFNFTRAPIADELLSAHCRGVDVRLVMDGGSPSDRGSQVPRLIAGLGRDRVTVCAAPGTACIGNGIMHHKTFLFSQLSDGSRNVVVQGSHNFTNAQLRMHNNVLIVRDDAPLFAGFERVFDEQRRDTVNLDYYRILDGALDTRAYFFPRASGDTAVSIIDNVTCGGTATIRVAMAFFTDARIAVARALAARAREGCSVELVVGNAEIPAGDSVVSTLRAAGARVTLYPERTGMWGLHSKYMIIDAVYVGARQQLVFTGSHNWTGPALTSNDETLLKVQDAALFRAYLADWTATRDAALRP